MKVDFPRISLALVAFTSLCLVVLFLVSLYSGYPAFILSALAAIGQQSNIDIALTFISKNEFQLLQVVLLFSVLLLCYVLFRHRVIFAGWAEFSRFIFSRFGFALKSIQSSGGKYLLVIPFIASGYYAITMPVTYDEAWTYLYFTSNSPLASLSFYPVSNNHVLFSLVSNLTYYLPFIPDLIAFRLSSVVFSILTWILLLYITRKWFGEKSGWLMTGLASMLFMSVYYSYMARGYALFVLFFLLMGYATYRILENPEEKNYWRLYKMSGILGCLTLPTFIMPVLTFGLLLLLRPAIPKATWIRSHLIIAFCTAFLYLPIIIVNGFNAILNKQARPPLPFDHFLSDLMDFLVNFLPEITGWPFVFILLLLAITVILLIMQRKGKVLRLAGLFLLVPIILMFVQSVTIFPRNLVYFGMLFTVFILLPYGNSFNNFHRSTVLKAALFFQLACWINFHNQIRKYEALNISFHEVAVKIAEPGKRYYFNADLFDTNFAFEMKTRGYEMKEAVNFYPTIKSEINADTMSGYDYIITDKDVDRTILRKPSISTQRMNVYQ